MSLQSPELWNVNLLPPGSPKSRDVFICPTYYWLGQSRDWEIWKTTVWSGEVLLACWKVCNTKVQSTGHILLNSLLFKWCSKYPYSLRGRGGGVVRRINKWSFSHSTTYWASLRALIPKTTTPVLTSIAAILPSQARKTHIYDHSKNLRTWLKPMQNGNR